MAALLTIFTDFIHVPNVLYSTGIIDILSICNILEIANALAYSLTDLERHLLIEARRICRVIVAWLSVRFLFTVEQNRRLDLYNDIWMLFLAKEVKSILVYQDILEQQGLLLRPGFVQRRLDLCFDGNSSFQSKFASLDESKPSQFGWTHDLDFVVTIRDSPQHFPLGKNA